MQSRRKIPASGINLFQLIYTLIREYESTSGNRCLNLSLGNPDLIPFDTVLKLKKKFADAHDYDLHTYAEDKNLNRFCEGLIHSFTGITLSDHSHLRASAIAGIKTATAILPLACGLHLKGRSEFNIVTHLPAYDVMGTWGASYLGANRIVWPLHSRDGMRMNLSALKDSLAEAGVDPHHRGPDLIFVIRPGNPASIGAQETEWRELIEFCEKRGTRLVNDGAYTTLSDRSSHTPLACVAKDYPGLEWAELYSLSKSLSDPGQRLGVMLGSKEFIEDFNLLKGNTDSGPVPLGMMAYGELFKDRDTTGKLLRETYATYQRRLNFLVPKLREIGLRPACETTSGFFTLWLTPDEAFGIDLVKESREKNIPRAELFNRLVIEKTGIVGVHFTSNTRLGSESFIRYAVCTDVLEAGFQSRFAREIARIQPRYF